MEMDVNLSKVGAIELVGISGLVAGGRGLGVGRNSPLPISTVTRSGLIAPTSPRKTAKPGCCSCLSLLLSRNNSNGNSNNSLSEGCSGISSITSGRKSNHRTPQEIYFESRGKSCKKLLKFNGNSNKILLYPEEGWARTASSSYWTITPCWLQPNRCRIEEFMGSQRNATKAKMLQLEQKGSLLIFGNFNQKKSKESEFKLYLSSNISIEDYNMGYCLTGFVERRCQQTNTFQMTHFAVIKRQWPSISHDSKSTSTQ